jgi:activator of 2-hydroxyglutaryl-CoA dehydratase
MGSNDIIDDLAKCTKYLVLTKRIRAGTDLERMSSTVSLHDGVMERTIMIGLDDGSEYTGVVLLDDAHEAWENLLTGHGLL